MSTTINTTSNGLTLTGTLVSSYVFVSFFYAFNKGFSSIDVDAFQNYSYLTDINLNGNKLSFIKKGTFDNLINLEDLNLNNYQFVSLEDLLIKLFSIIYH